MPYFLEIAVHVPQVTGLFHYHLPPELEEPGVPEVLVGRLAVVPFGQQTVQGVVLRIIDHPEVPETRPVLGWVDPQAVLTPQQLALARDLAETSLASLSDCIGLMLPPGLLQFADTLYSLARSPQVGEKKLGEVQGRLVSLLEKRGPLRSQQIDYSLKHINWRPSARQLVQQGFLASRSILPPPTVRPRFVRTAELACPLSRAESLLAEAGKMSQATFARRLAVLRFLGQEARPVLVSWIYAECGAKADDLHYLAEHDLVVLGESESWRDPLAPADETDARADQQAPELTTAQQQAWASLQPLLQAAADGQPVRPALLYGVTGSGKTEIYLRAVEETLKLGRQALILVPEISLTPQTLHRFQARFPGQVGVIHSKLSVGERYDTWRRARLGRLAVIVGPRSALFAPLPNPGLVVVDECHDDSYYQSESAPYYHARRAAIAYARVASAVCLLGSATPDMESAYAAAQGAYHLLRLPQRIGLQLAERAQRPGSSPQSTASGSGGLPVVRVVDMRQELKEGNRSIFSRLLQAELARVLDAGQQAILFLNRRGTATYVFCRDCGYVLKCPRCNLPLTYHLPQGKLVCHLCDYQRKMPESCPVCSSKQIRHFGTGTEQVEAQVQKLFPQARTLRWDYESTRQKGTHEVILGHFMAHRADILVGTQMLAKGLDLPLVTLVGIVLADVGLSLPDYRVGERTFALLTQVAGRAGRSQLGGQVVLQTFQPQDYVIQAAAAQDFRGFYEKEIAQRRRLGYPPFTRLLRLEYRHADPVQAERAAQQLAADLRAGLAAGGRTASQLIGPAPCFFARQAGDYRWQIILRGSDPVELLRGKKLVDWIVEVDPTSLL